MRNVSGLTAAGAVLALICLGIAAAMLIAPEANDRLALVFGMIGLALPVFLGNLKADQAASNTNGKLDARIQAAVHRAQNARRRGERPLTETEVDNLHGDVPSPVSPEERVG
jgi:hypothetical protein